MRPPNSPLLWIDNSLSPLVANALKDVGYNAVVQADLPEFRRLTRVLDDEHIIPWCRDNDAIWIHADDNARTEHAKQIVTANVRTIWVYLPPGFKASSREQLRLLAFCLPDVLADMCCDDPAWRHYEIRPMGRRIRLSGFILEAGERS
ncbi:MAG: hypothetical protein ACRDG3_04360 [Tepidiformaceae bacterium]